MTDFLNMSPEQIAALPTEVREIIHQKMLDLLRELGVTPMVTPDGQFAVDLAQLAPALGMTMDEAQEHLDQVGVQGASRDDLVTLQ